MFGRHLFEKSLFEVFNYFSTEEKHHSKLIPEGVAFTQFVLMIQNIESVRDMTPF
jgi:hypothetical protein